MLGILVVAACVFLAHKLQSNAFIDNNVVNGVGNSCNFINETCEFNVNDQVAIAHFSIPPIPEESVTVSITLPQDLIIESAWIEGVNMYMGKIPVLLESETNTKWTGWFMLGSCSEPVMRWQLRLNIKGQETPNYLYFITQT